MSWQLVPRKGLGKLDFGMSPSEVAFFEDEYGKLDRVVGAPDLSSSVEETIRMFGSSFSPEDIAALRKQAAEQASAARRTEVRMGGAVVLDYEQGRLAAIQLSPEANMLEMAGSKVFLMSAKQLIELLERENGMPGRYRLNEASFDQLAVSLNGFTKLVSETDFEILADDDPLAAEKTLTLREKPYVSGETGYFVISAF